jgi:hypothetical protein
LLFIIAYKSAMFAKGGLLNVSGGLPFTGISDFDSLVELSRSRNGTVFDACFPPPFLYFDHCAAGTRRDTKPVEAPAFSRMFVAQKMEQSKENAKFFAD